MDRPRRRAAGRPAGPPNAPPADADPAGPPAAGTPSVSPPAADIPSADIPPADIPSADIPSADIPSADIPSADIPSTDHLDAILPGDSADAPQHRRRERAPRAQPTRRAAEQPDDTGRQERGDRRQPTRRPRTGEPRAAAGSWPVANDPAEREPAAVGAAGSDAAGSDAVDNGAVESDAFHNDAATGAPAARDRSGTAVPEREDRRRGEGREDRRRGESAMEWSLRALVSTRTTQLPFDVAMRAREVAQPSAQDLADAERDLVLVRRHYVPLAPLVTKKPDAGGKGSRPDDSAPRGDSRRGGRRSGRG